MKNALLFPTYTTRDNYKKNKAFRKIYLKKLQNSDRFKYKKDKLGNFCFPFLKYFTCIDCITKKIFFIKLTIHTVNKEKKKKFFCLCKKRRLSQKTMLPLHEKKKKNVSRLKRTSKTIKKKRLMHFQGRK